MCCRHTVYHRQGVLLRALVHLAASIAIMVRYGGESHAQGHNCMDLWTGSDPVPN